jgi:hypothetical protein
MATAPQFRSHLAMTISPSVDTQKRLVCVTDPPARVGALIRFDDCAIGGALS